MSSRGKRCWVPAVLTARSPPLDPTVASSSQTRLMRPQLLSDGTYVLSLCLNYTRLCPVCQPFWMVGSASISKGREKGGIDAAIPCDGIWLRLQDTDRSAGTPVNVPPVRDWRLLCSFPCWTRSARKLSPCRMLMAAFVSRSNSHPHSHECQRSDRSFFTAVPHPEHT